MTFHPQIHTHLTKRANQKRKTNALYNPARSTDSKEEAVLLFDVFLQIWWFLFCLSLINCNILFIIIGRNETPCRHHVMKFWDKRSLIQWWHHHSSSNHRAADSFIDTAVIYAVIYSEYDHHICNIRLLFWQEFFKLITQLAAFTELEK